ncbi:hypothetical protein [Acinetobacter baumannii]|uniref:hypothetical protein n=1 Tax=Acinetobacter baumannii TaxID=470 RepID=UPI0027424DAA|nr:hypothetical protein [Acinetobacter baumannii]MDP7695153.1 hypothetical protein [Acinetobacter baumannii]WOQ31308.1 hypothetical protein R3H33_06345 [Acinetobacter baumannii]
MSEKYSFLLLVMAIFGIALVRTGKYTDSFVYAVSIAYLVLFCSDSLQADRYQ